MQPEVAQLPLDPGNKDWEENLLPSLLDCGITTGIIPWNCFSKQDCADGSDRVWEQDSMEIPAHREAQSSLQDVGFG